MCIFVVLSQSHGIEPKGDIAFRKNNVRKENIAGYTELYIIYIHIYMYIYIVYYLKGTASCSAK